MLYKWKEKIEAELKRLRKENKELRMEKEILNKASEPAGHAAAKLYSLAGTTPPTYAL